MTSPTDPIAEVQDILAPVESLVTGAVGTVSSVAGAFSAVTGDVSAIANAITAVAGAQKALAPSSGGTNASAPAGSSGGCTCQQPQCSCQDGGGTMLMNPDGLSSKADECDCSGDKLMTIHLTVDINGCAKALKGMEVYKSLSKAEGVLSKTFEAHGKKAQTIASNLKNAVHYTFHTEEANRSSIDGVL